MPQPLSNIAPNANIMIGNVGDYPLQRHPDLAYLIAEVISSWSNVEAFHLRLFIDLLGGPQDKAAAVFLALEARSSRLAAIQAVARLLPEPHRKLLAAIMAISRSQAKLRDKIAHGTWGDTQDLPNALLWESPKEQVTASEPFDTSNIFVYREQDFKKIIVSNERLAGFGLKLRFILNDHPANRDNELYEQLCRESEIEEQLRRLNRENKARPPK